MVAPLVPEERQLCPRDFRSYLEANYTCLPGKENCFISFIWFLEVHYLFALHAYKNSKSLENIEHFVISLLFFFSNEFKLQPLPQS